MRLQHNRGEDHQRLQEELQQYIGENQRLRLQLDSLKAEVASLEQVRSRDEREVQEVIEALTAAEKGIAERDKLIKTLQVGIGGWDYLHRPCRERFGGLQVQCLPPDAHVWVLWVRSLRRCFPTEPRQASRK